MRQPRQIADHPFVPEGRFASLLVRDKDLARQLADGFKELWNKAMRDIVQGDNPQQFRGVFPADDGYLGDALSPQLDHDDVERLVRARQFEILTGNVSALITISPETTFASVTAPSITGRYPGIRSSRLRSPLSTV
ncbi:MAG TPA: hypothetical protein VFY40_26670 [Blastocatellia bacterium]|nr:hypothetical protein [Blastocatellia bacterium]